MMPSQKCGTDRPESAARLARKSTGVPLRVAERTPAGRPSRSATSIEPKASSMVTGSLEARSSDTGMRLRSDSPKSPQDLAEPNPVLHHHGPVQVVLGAYRGHGRGVTLLPGQSESRVA